jgi:hypothetical protein
MVPTLGVASTSALGVSGTLLSALLGRVVRVRLLGLLLGLPLWLSCAAEAGDCCDLTAIGAMPLPADNCLTSPRCLAELTAAAHHDVNVIMVVKEGAR